MIRKATSEDGLKEAWHSVFLGPDPFCWPFRNREWRGTLLHPTAGYSLTGSQFSALMKTVRGPFAITCVEGMAFLDGEFSYVCSAATYAEYDQLCLPLENTAFALDGSWGVIVSHELHAIVGGGPGWLGRFRENYPAWTEERDRLIEYWKGESDRWLDEVLEHTARPA